MSITSEELNYLIWRYLQESGHEVAALAMEEETRVLEFEQRFKEHIPVGSLVHLVQKGILYSESELLVGPEGKLRTLGPEERENYKRNFTLVQALEVDKQRYPELVSKGRFELENDVEAKLLAEKEEAGASGAGAGASGPGGSGTTSGNGSSFIKTLSGRLTVPESFVCEWSPVQEDAVALGGSNATAKIAKVVDWALQDSVELVHPIRGQAGSTEVISLWWSHDGELVLTGTRQGELRLWNKQGKLKNILDSHRSPIVAAKWNDDCTHLLTTDVSNVVILWSTLTGTQLQHFSFTEDESAAAGGTDGPTDTDSMQQQPDSLGIALEWIETDKFVVPGPSGSLLVYTIGDNKPLGRLLGHKSTITALHFNPVTKSLLSASDDDTIKIWKGGNVNPSLDFSPHKKTISSADWLTDDLVVSTGYDGAVKVWSVSQNTSICETNLDSEPIFEASLSPNKEWLAVGTLQGSAIVLDMRNCNSESLKSAYAEYQPDHDGLQVTNIAWNSHSSAFAVSYIDGTTTLLEL